MAQPAAVLSILVRANTGDAVRGIARVQTQLGATQAAGSKALGAIKTFAKGAAIGTGVGLGYAIKKAADFEQQLDSLGSVSGATGKQMEQFKRQAMAAGAATKFSALDAAAAQTELAKGGLSVSRIMKGGLRSALSLAAAGEMDLAQAAGTTANAMKLFGLRGKESEKVADALATAANRTTADVKDFALALRMGGSVAKLAGLSFNDTIVALEALAEAGIKGSDAGTSLKAFFLNIATPSTKAAKAMDELGVSLFDTQGNLKTLPGIAKNLRGAFGDLTKEQFLNKAGIIAGSDAIRTLYSLYSAGPDKLNRLASATAKHGTAAQVAAEKQDNLKGKLENLKGSIETVAIAIGSKMLPALTDAAEKVTDIINDPKLTSAEKFDRLAKMAGEAFEKAIPVIAEAAGKAGIVAAKALFDGFRNSGLLAKLVIGGFLLAKMGGLGAFTKLGSQAGGAMAEGTATTFGARMKGRMASLGKNVLGLSLAMGIGQALTAENVSKGGRFQEFLSGATFGLVPSAERAAQEAVVAANKVFQQGGSKADMGKILFASTDMDDQTKEIIAGLFEVRRRAEKVLGKGVEFKVGLDPSAANRGIFVLDRNFDKFRDHTTGSVTQVRKIVDSSMRAIEATMGLHSNAGRKAMRKNLGAGVGEIRDLMRSGIVTAEAGSKAIRDLMVRYLATFGIKGKGASQLARQFGAKGLQNLEEGKTISGHTLGDPAGGHKLQRGGGLPVPGSGSGDKVMLRAMVEPGEKVFVLNRNASSALDQLQGLNSAVPRFQTGGAPKIPRVNVTGPASYPKVITQAELDITRMGAQKKLNQAAAAAAIASAGGETSTKGLVSQVLRALAFAKSHGWGGSVISGLRSEAEQVRIWNSGIRPAAKPKSLGGPGSNHSLGQAVDVSDAVTFDRLMDLAPRNAKLFNLVPNDFHHFSVTGHQRGGLVGLQNGGSVMARAAAKLPIPRKDWELAQRIGEKFGVDPRVLVAIGLHETGWGKYGLGRDGLILGVGAYDTGATHQWAGVQPQLRKGASLLKGWGVHGIGDIAAGKASSWATDPGWESAVVAKFNEIKGQLPKGSAEDIRRRETDLFKRKLRKVKRPKSKLLDKIKGVGLPGGLEKKIGTLTLEADKFAEFADMASQLTAEGADGQSVFGMVGGQGEPEWLFLELDRLFKLRNALIRAHELLVAYRERLSGGIERAQKKIGTIDRQLTKKGLSTVARRKLRLERGGLVRLVRGLEGRRGKVNTARGDTLEGLEGVQGAFAPMKVMSALPDIGVLGGRIFETQLALRDLGEKPAVTDSTTGDSESAAILRELLKQSQQRFQVSQAQYPVFHQGGVVPGPVGQERMAVVQSGEGVFTPGQMQAMGTTDVHIHFAPGTEWLSDFLKVEIDRGGRRSTRGGRAPLPGRGGGI